MKEIFGFNQNVESVGESFAQIRGKVAHVVEQVCTVRLGSHSDLF